MLITLGICHFLTYRVTSFFCFSFWMEIIIKLNDTKKPTTTTTITTIDWMNGFWAAANVFLIFINSFSTNQRFWCACHSSANLVVVSFAPLYRVTPTCDLKRFETSLSLISNSCGRFRSKLHDILGRWILRELCHVSSLLCVCCLKLVCSFPTQAHKGKPKNDADWLICFQIKPSRSTLLFDLTVLLRAHDCFVESKSRRTKNKIKSRN